MIIIFCPAPNPISLLVILLLPLLRCVMQESLSPKCSHQKSNADDWSKAVKTSLEKRA